MLDTMIQSLDIHCHSSVGSSCSEFTPEEIVAFNNSLELPAFVITDHHSFEGANQLKNQINVIAGVEICIRNSLSNDFGDFLIFSEKDLSWIKEQSDSLFGVRYSIKLEKAISLGLFDKENLVVWCHPPYTEEDWFKLCLSKMREHISAIEILNFNAKVRNYEYNLEILKKFNLEHLPQLANSDAHSAQGYMVFYNNFSVPVLNVHDLIVAVKEKKFTLETSERDHASERKRAEEKDEIGRTGKKTC